MSSLWVILAYGAALGLALFLLYQFKAQAWYWHGLSIAAAVSMGFIPPPQGLAGPIYDLLFGALFAFLIVWGVGGALMFRTHQAHHKHA